jgi:hypothetical protein
MLSAQAFCRLRHISSMALRNVAVGSISVAMGTSVGLVGFLASSRFLKYRTLPAACVGLFASTVSSSALSTSWLSRSSFAF